MRVRRKSAWLLHFTAALPIRLPWQLDNLTLMLGALEGSTFAEVFPEPPMIHSP
jgi:hypothetical protein